VALQVKVVDEALGPFRHPWLPLTIRRLLAAACPYCQIDRAAWLPLMGAAPAADAPALVHAYTRAFVASRPERLPVVAYTVLVTVLAGRCFRELHACRGLGPDDPRASWASRCLATLWSLTPPASRCSRRPNGSRGGRSVTVLRGCQVDGRLMTNIISQSVSQIHSTQ
jgi:hypothetical protein